MSAFSILSLVLCTAIFTIVSNIRIWDKYQKSVNGVQKDKNYTYEYTKVYSKLR